MANPNSSAQRSFAAEPYDSVAAVLASKQLTPDLIGQRIFTKDGYCAEIVEDGGTDITAGGAQLVYIHSPYDPATDELNYKGIATFGEIADVSIPDIVQAIQTSGYATAGDGGGATYRRVSSEPGHAGKAHSADGSWWELSVNVANPFMFGAKGDLVQDDAPAINSCFEYFRIKNCGCYIPSPKSGYAISSPLQVYLTADWESQWRGYRGKQVSIEKGAAFLATEEMPYMLILGQEIEVGDEYAGIVRDGLLQGGRFDCNNMADYGIRVPFFELVRIVDVTVRNAKVDYFYLGDAGTPAGSYEGMLTRCYTDRAITSTSPVGSLGVRFEGGGDHHMFDCVIKGVHRAGVGGGGTWNMKLNGVHVWNNAEHGPVEYGFDLMGQNQLIGCQVDEEWLYAAYRFRGANNFLIGSNITKEHTDPGGHFVDLATAGASATSIACKIVATSGHELAGEVTGLGYANYRSFANDISTPNRSNNGVIHSGSGIQTGVFTVATLPTSPVRGTRAFVVDSSVTTFGSVLSGGGSDWVPVFYNGTNWCIG